MSKYRIRMNGKVYEMEIELVDEKEEKANRPHIIPSVSHKNSDSVVQVINPETERQTHFEGNTVKTPMPGLVIKVLAKVGDVVAKDEPVIILEAMKMENEICTPCNGIIKDVFVAEGQTIAGATPLFEIESEEIRLA